MDFSATMRKKEKGENCMELELPCLPSPLDPGTAIFHRFLTSIDSQDSVRESGVAQSRTKSDPKISLALSPFLSGNESTPAVDSGNLKTLTALHQRLGFSLSQFLKDHEVPGSDKSTPTYNFPILDPYLKEEEQEDYRFPAEFLTDHEADDEASAAEVHSNLKNRRAGKQRVSRHDLRYQYLRGRNTPQHIGSDMENEINDNFELPFNLKSAKSQPMTSKDTQPRASKLVPHSSSCPARVIAINTSSEEEDSDSNSDRDSEYETEAMMGSQDEMILDTESSSSDSVSETGNKENRQPYSGIPDISDPSFSSTNSPTEYVLSDLATERSRNPTNTRRHGSLAEAKGYCDSRKFPAQGPRAQNPGNSAPGSSLARDLDNSGSRGKNVIDWLRFVPSASPHSYESPGFVPIKRMITYIKEIGMVEVAPGFFPEPTCGRVTKGKLEADAKPTRLDEELTHCGNREKKNVHGEQYESLEISSRPCSTVQLNTRKEAGTRDRILRGGFADEEKKVMLDRSASAKSGRRIIPLERMRVKKPKSSNEVENLSVPEKTGEESDNCNSFAGLWSGVAGAKGQVKKDYTAVDGSKERSGSEENSKAERKP